MKYRYYLNSAVVATNSRSVISEWMCVLVLILLSDVYQ